MGIIILSLQNVVITLQNVVTMDQFIQLFPNRSFVKVLILFLIHSEQKFYQSSIAESTKIALIQVQRALKRLENAGLITKAKSGNRLYYSSNKKHPAFEDIKRALIKTILCGDLLKDALKLKENNIQFSFIYGSMANGNETFNSDIDLFIIGDLKLRDIASILSKMGKNLGREINSTTYTEREFKKKLKEKNPFIIEVFNKPKIWLFGDECEFKKLDK